MRVSLKYNAPFWGWRHCRNAVNLTSCKWKKSSKSSQELEANNCHIIHVNWLEHKRAQGGVFKLVSSRQQFSPHRFSKPDKKQQVLTFKKQEIDIKLVDDQVSVGRVLTNQQVVAALTKKTP